MLEKLLQDIELRDFSAESEDLIKQNKMKIEELSKIKTKYAILSNVVFIGGLVLLIPGCNAVIDSSEASTGSLLAASAGWIMFIIGCVIGGKHKRCVTQIETLERYLVPAYADKVLRQSVRDNLLTKVLNESWVCPYCAEPNDLQRVEKCEHCGKAYNAEYVRKYKKALLASGELPPTMK